MTQQRASGSIRILELKTKPLADTIERLEQAREAGVTHLDLLNKGRPVLHVGYPDDLPARWHRRELQSVPFIDVRRGHVSLTRLRKEGRAFLLTQRRGPSLALWPLEADYVRPPEQAAADMIAYLARTVRRLEGELGDLRDEVESQRKQLGKRSEELDRFLGCARDILDARIRAAPCDDAKPAKARRKAGDDAAA
jgi:hypothetical protein